MSGDSPDNGRRGGQGSRSLTSAASPAADEDAERAVLGGLLLYANAQMVSQLVGKGLRREHFYWETHGDVYAAAVSLSEQRIGTDPITVYAEMERLGTTRRITRQQVDELTGRVPTTRNLSAYAEQVIRMAAWRERLHKAYDQIAAIERRDDEAWEAAIAAFAPSTPQSNGNGRGPRTLRLVDEHGEVVEEQRYCDACQELQDQLDGVAKEIAGWRTRYANLKRDKEREARSDGHWQSVQRLFEYWKKKTNHQKSPFTAARFYQCAPYYRDPKYGPEKVERAIVGIAYDPFVTTRLNGTKKRHDDWDLLFRSSGKFEEYCNRAPLTWKSELNLEPVKPVADQAQLTVVEGSAG